MIQVLFALIVLIFLFISLLIEDDAVRNFIYGLLIGMAILFIISNHKSVEKGKRMAIIEIAERYGASTEPISGYVVLVHKDFKIYFPNKEKLDSFIMAIKEGSNPGEGQGGKR